MGLEDLYVRGGSAYWVVEKQGTFVDSDVRKIYIGTVSGESIELSAEFGGGSISVAAAKALTARHVYLSGATEAGARLAIRDSLAGVAMVNRKSVTAAAAQGFAQGARVGAEGFGEGATFGLVQASDWAKSQPEFALSRNIGTGTTLLAGVVLSAGSAAAVTGGTTFGTAMTSTTVTSGALSLGTAYGSGELGSVILVDTGLVLAWSAGNKSNLNVATDLDPISVIGTWMYGVQQHTFGSYNHPQRSVSAKRADFLKNPSKWRRLQVQASQSKTYKGGISLESAYENIETGETLYIHELYDQKLNDTKQHPSYRNYGKLDE
jgi:hypothetical protein